jgi:hypothetical protein
MLTMLTHSNSILPSRYLDGNQTIQSHMIGKW